MHFMFTVIPHLLMKSEQENSLKSKKKMDIIPGVINLSKNITA
jgi:hypothetical protein